MREMEFSLQIQLNGNIFFAIFRLPPWLLTRSWLIFVNNLTDSMVTQRIIHRIFIRFTQKAFLLFQMWNDTETFGTMSTACWRCCQTLLTTNQQISSGWITRTLLTRMYWLSRSISCIWTIQNGKLAKINRERKMFGEKC